MPLGNGPEAAHLAERFFNHLLWPSQTTTHFLTRKASLTTTNGISRVAIGTWFRYFGQYRLAT